MGTGDILLGVTLRLACITGVIEPSESLFLRRAKRETRARSARHEREVREEEWRENNACGQGILYCVDWTSKTRTSKTRTCKTWTCKTRTSKTQTCKTRTCKTRTCKTRTCKARTCKTRTSKRRLPPNNLFINHQSKNLSIICGKHVTFLSH